MLNEQQRIFTCLINYATMKKSLRLKKSSLEETLSFSLKKHSLFVWFRKMNIEMKILIIPILNVSIFPTTKLRTILKKIGNPYDINRRCIVAGLQSKTKTTINCFSQEAFLNIILVDPF
jgi:hypothetical protein